jgi:hypothetical protein
MKVVTQIEFAAALMAAAVVGRRRAPWIKHVLPEEALVVRRAQEIYAQGSAGVIVVSSFLLEV